MRLPTLPASRWFPALGLLLALAVTGCGATLETGEQASTAAAPKLKLVQVASGFTRPTHLASTPSEPSRLYVVEQAGRIRVLADGVLQPDPFLDIRNLVGSDGNEQGLLSVVFHPRYSTNGLFYVDYTDKRGDTRVVEYQSQASGPPVRRRQLLWVDQPYSNHNGGQLAFGPDGYLYVGMGDGGSGGDPEDRAQKLASRLGKLLRRSVDRPGAKWQTAGYGLRNPWRFSFDRATGDLYIADVGQDEWEEIDFTPRSSPGLENYGWDVYEGKHRYETKSLNPAGKLVWPITEYGRSQGCSVTGGFVYRGSAVTGARGRYFYGDYCSGRVWSLVVRDGRATNVRREPFNVEAISSFGEDAAGELHLVSLGGTIYRLARG